MPTQPNNINNRGESASESTSLLIGQSSYTESASDGAPLLGGPERHYRRPICYGCKGCWSCFSKASEHFIAAMGGSTAPNGAQKASQLYFDNPGYDLSMALLAWYSAYYTNYSSSPINSIKHKLKAGIAPGPKSTLTSVSSAIAAVSSGFLATATPYKLYDIIRQLLGYSALTSVGWPLICCGIMVMCFNTKTSWNVGNTATAMFVHKYPKIREDLRTDPVKAGTAVLLAILSNLVITLPFSDGIADSIAGIASHEGDITARLQYLFFGQAQASIDKPQLYNIIYWALMGGTMPANIISLTTFTFGPSYNFFFNMMSTFESFFLKLDNPALAIATRVEQNSWSRTLSTGMLASVLTLAYGAAYGGFSASTLLSPNWDFLGINDSTAKGVGLGAAAVTWGVMLFEKFYYLIRPAAGARNKYYVMMQDYASYLYDKYNEQQPPNTNYCLVLNQDNITKVTNLTDLSNTPLYRDYRNQAQLSSDNTNNQPDRLTRDDMVELVSIVCDEATFLSCYDQSMSLISGQSVTKNLSLKTIILHKKTGEDHPITAVFNFKLSYHYKNPIVLEMNYSQAPAAHIALDMTTSQQRISADTGYSSSALGQRASSQASSSSTDSTDV